MLRISEIHAREILDSRGCPTISTSVTLSNGSHASAHVPSGASTGKHEALELRDHDPLRYRGKGVLRAIGNVNDVLAPELRGANAEDQPALDARMIDLDGTEDKSRLGANAILSISCGVARAAAMARSVPLWQSLPSGQIPRMPVPIVNIISGGLHAGNLIEIQDFLVVRNGYPPLSESLEAIVGIHHATRDLLAAKGYPITGVADEGGWGPGLDRNESALNVLTEAIDLLDLKDRFSFGIDVAASHFYRDGRYHLSSEDRSLNPKEMVQMLDEWCSRYAISSIEDGLAEDDWEGWELLTQALGSKVQMIGDDLFTTHPGRLRRGIAKGVANAVLVKMNQIGTLTETFEVVRIAREAGYRVIVSARSGETEDSFVADLAVACGADQIKVGSVTRSERLAKYNRLLEIESQLLSDSGPVNPVNAVNL
jgi:enolase